VTGTAPLTSGSNGNLSSSDLSPITGGVSCSDNPLGGQLSNTAAAAWNHESVVTHNATGSWPASNGCASSYRSYHQQVVLREYWCNLGNCGNAAVPGTSNHGWGTAVDGNSVAVWLAGHSPYFDVSGGCSDAPWEPWHIHYCGGYSGGDPGPYGQGGGGGGGGHTFPVLKHGSHGPRVQKLQRHLFYLHNTGSGTQNGYLVKWSFITGFYGDHTKYAVHKLQHDGNLTTDGVYGKHTAEYRWNRWGHFCKKHPHKAPCRN